MSHVCPSCGAADQIKTEIKEDRFQYGEGDDAPWLSVDVPVHTCTACEMSYIDHVGMDLRSFVTLKHLIHRGDVPMEALQRLYPEE